MISGSHEDLQCIDCHIPGGVQQGEYNSEEKCWTCHMPPDGQFDKILPVTMPEDGSLDKWIPPEAKGTKQASAENLPERVKYYKHLSHKFKVHMKMDKK